MTLSVSHGPEVKAVAHTICGHTYTEIFTGQTRSTLTTVVRVPCSWLNDI